LCLCNTIFCFKIQKQKNMFIKIILNADSKHWLLTPILTNRPINKPGGLDCLDQSRSRFLDLSRCPFLKCRDFLDSWDVLFQSVKIKSLDLDKDKNWEKLRLYSIGFVKICRDVIFQTVENFLTVKIETLDRDHVKSNCDPQA